MILKCDLHIHSCLSPCGSLEMSPKHIAEIAVEKGLDLIALTDHNCALNSPAFEKACSKAGITPLFGIEATTSEEFHSLCLFGSVTEAVNFSDELYEKLLSVPNKPEIYGDQVIVDENDNILGEVGKYLTGGALAISSDQLLKQVINAGGLFIPAHIDRAVFSLASQLGFLPPDPYSALEIISYPPPFNTGNIPLITSSDAHYPEDIGKRYFLLESESKSFRSIKEAIFNGKINLSI